MMSREEYEKLEREFEEMMATPLPKAKPKPVAVVTVPVSDRDAAVIAANPESVRVSARRDDGVSVLMKPQGNPHHVTVMVDWVREVDASGRPVRDCGGVVHEYNPLDALRRVD
jgi:hypothetical protein